MDGRVGGPDTHATVLAGLHHAAVPSCKVLGYAVCGRAQEEGQTLPWLQLHWQVLPRAEGFAQCWHIISSESAA